MQSRTKSTIVILIVLVIGFVLGSLTSGALRQRRVDRFRHLSPQDQFRETMENIIRPDNRQRMELEQIWEKQDHRIAEIQENSAIQIMNFVDSLKLEFNSILTDEQQYRLQEHMNTMHEKFMRIRIGHMTRLLDLTDGQVKELRGIFEKHRHMMPDGMFGFKTRSTSRDREHFRQMESEIENLLTPDQLKKYQEYRQKRKRPEGAFIFYKEPGPGEYPHRDQPGRED